MTSAKGHHFLLVFGDNFVKIHTDTSSKSYFCAGLEADALDENWTEKTMEDFHSALKNRNIPVIWKLD